MAIFDVDYENKD